MIDWSEDDLCSIVQENVVPARIDHNLRIRLCDWRFPLLRNADDGTRSSDEILNLILVPSGSYKFTPEALIRLVLDGSPGTAQSLVFLGSYRFLQFLFGRRIRLQMYFARRPYSALSLAHECTSARAANWRSPLLTLGDRINALALLTLRVAPLAHIVFSNAPHFIRSPHSIWPHSCRWALTIRLRRLGAFI